MLFRSVATSHPEMIQHIQESVYATLKIYASSEIVPQSHYLQSHRTDAGITVIGMLELKNKDTTSVLALGFSNEVFFTIYENMFKEKLTEVSLETADLAGELVNIIFQSIDPELRKMGYLFDASLPKVLTKLHEHEWGKISVDQSLVLPFSTVKGEILFEIFETKG